MGSVIQDLNPSRLNCPLPSPKHPEQLWLYLSPLFNGYQGYLLGEGDKSAKVRS